MYLVNVEGDPAAGDGSAERKFGCPYSCSFKVNRGALVAVCLNNDFNGSTIVTWETIVVLRSYPHTHSKLVTKALLPLPWLPQTMSQMLYRFQKQLMGSPRSQSLESIVEMP